VNKYLIIRVSTLFIKATHFITLPNSKIYIICILVYLFIVYSCYILKQQNNNNIVVKLLALENNMLRKNVLKLYLLLKVGYYCDLKYIIS